MPQACRACHHPDRAEIDRALARRLSLREIARRYGLSKAGLARHRDRHLLSRLTLAPDVLGHGDLHAIMAELGEIKSAVALALEQAERAHDPAMVLKAAAELRAILALLGQFAGTLREHHSVSIDYQPVVGEVMAVLRRALRDHPDALAAATYALANLEAPAADDAHPTTH